MNAFKPILNFISILNIFFLSLAVAFLVSDSVSGEHSPATIRFLLSKPVTRTKVIMSKFIAAFLILLFSVIVMEFIIFIIMGAIFGFNGVNQPIPIGTQYVYDGSEQLEGASMRAILGSTSITPLWKYIFSLIGLQSLYLFACVAFCFLISTLIRKSSISISVSFILTISMSIFTIFYNPNSVLFRFIGKILPLVFITYSNTVDIISGVAALKLGNPIISPNSAVIILLLWSINCYAISNLIFLKRDITS